MAGLFETNTASKYNAQQQQMIKKAQKKALRQIDLKKADEPLANEYLRLASGKGFKPNSSFGPGHNILMDKKGNVTMNRTGEAQGVMDRLLAGIDLDESGFGNLLSQISPGFGRLTNARGAEADNARARGISNLKEQLAKRRVLGASFANDQIGSMERQYMMDKDKILAESIVQEMEMTNNVLQARTQARNQSVAVALNEIQFETGTQAAVQMQASKTLNDLSLAMTDIAKMRGQLSMQGMIARGNISANLSNTGIASQTEFANLESQEKAAPGQLLGTLAGAAIGGWASGGLGGLGGIGGGIGSGGLMAPKTSVFELVEPLK